MVPMLTPTSVPLFRRWFVACTAGELLGFGAAALWARLAYRLVGDTTFLSPSANGAPSSEPALPIVLAGSVVFGALAGAAFGFAQWLVLRRHAADARRWITANAVGWALGLPWAFLAGDLADVRQSVSIAVAIGVLAGMLMGASVALATGHALVHMRTRVVDGR